MEEGGEREREREREREYLYMTENVFEMNFNIDYYENLFI